MAYKAVIFDLDGTLINSMDDIGLAMNRVLATNGYPTHHLDQYRFFVGEGARVLVHKALPEGAKTSETIERLTAAFAEDYGDNWKDKTRPYPGIPEMLKALKNKGILLTVLSNKSHDITVKCMDHFFSDHDFTIVLGQRPHVPKKPDPAGAMEISNALNIPAQEFVYMGDTGIDMRTATAAGMLPVGVLWGFRPESELTADGAKRLIDDPKLLLPLFEDASPTV